MTPWVFPAVSLGIVLLLLLREKRKKRVIKVGFNWGAFWKGLLKGGVTLTWSDGPMFDPSTQERTDAVDDIIKGSKCINQPPK